MKIEKSTVPLTKQIAVSAILLAICIASQFLKNLSVYITGPIINLCLILAVMMAGLTWGIVLSVITPVTAFLIAASPVMQAVPGIIPLIMCGNIVLVVMVALFFQPAITHRRPLFSPRSIVAAILCALAKGLFMGLTIALWLLPTFIPAESPLRGKMGVFRMTFSVTQFVTAIIGFVYFFIIWTPLKKAVVKEQ
ncbi:MAG: ECF transporter S component [Lachnospiraceae bacterium]|nr:ECF transporter S component [Lachnospiraceae bacterium]MBQ8948076.1 ECF transporter S component [Lachnospiraceae bacterium]